jgi:hypothetical protein
MGGARRRRDAALVFEYDKSLSCGLATGGYIAVRSAAPRMVRPSHPPRTGAALHMASRRVVHRLRPARHSSVPRGVRMPRSLGARRLRAPLASIVGEGWGARTPSAPPARAAPKAKHLYLSTTASHGDHRPRHDRCVSGTKLGFDRPSGNRPTDRGGGSDRTRPTRTQG